MNILLTGASSFTGYWFARALHNDGHMLVMPLRGPKDDYLQQPRAMRVRSLSSLGEILWDCPFGSPRFLEATKERPIDILCHHAATVANYRSDDFDIADAVRQNTHNISSLLRGMPLLRAVILTGSVFEENEGAGTHPLRAFSPYGISKGATASIFDFWCHKLNVSLGKFVIPNPFGPYEEPRFVRYLMQCFLKGEAAALQTPKYIRDNIHVDLLALRYLAFCNEMAADQVARKCNPSGYVESQEAFALRVAREVSKRLSRECRVAKSTQADFSEPLIRINTEPAEQVVEWSEEKAWDALVDFYTGAQ